MASKALARRSSSANVSTAQRILKPAAITRGLFSCPVFHALHQRRESLTHRLQVFKRLLVETKPLQPIGRAEYDAGSIQRPGQSFLERGQWSNSPVRAQAKVPLRRVVADEAAQHARQVHGDMVDLDA